MCSIYPGWRRNSYEMMTEVDENVSTSPIVEVVEIMLVRSINESEKFRTLNALKFSLGGLQLLSMNFSPRTKLENATFIR